MIDFLKSAVDVHHIDNAQAANFDLYLANHIYVPILAGLATIILGYKLWTLARR